MISLLALAGVAAIIFFGFRRHNHKVSVKQNIPEIIDSLLVLIRAGHSPAMAMSQLHNWSSDDLRQSLLQVKTELMAGEPFEVTMKNLRAAVGPNIYALCDILVSADRDGLPVVSVLDQLSFHSHQERQRLREKEAKELPVRLLFPLVFCILPSFVLLAMVPLLVSSLGSVSMSSI